jgi:hypothetical protein
MNRFATIGALAANALATPNMYFPFLHDIARNSGCGIQQSNQTDQYKTFTHFYSWLKPHFFGKETQKYIIVADLESSR